MTELTEREQKLIDIIKRLINCLTIYGIFFDRESQMKVWAYKSLESAGLNMEWQDKILKELESDFGLSYKKLDPKTLEEVKSDGNQS